MNFATHEVEVRAISETKRGGAASSTILFCAVEYHNHRIGSHPQLMLNASILLGLSLWHVSLCLISHT